MTCEGHRDVKDIIGADGVRLCAVRMNRYMQGPTDLRAMIVASAQDIAFTNPFSDCGVASVETAEQLMQGREKRRGRRRRVPAAFMWGIQQNVERGHDGR
jgi:hypothetical protein